MAKAEVMRKKDAVRGGGGNKVGNRGFIPHGWQR